MNSQLFMIATGVMLTAVGCSDDPTIDRVEFDVLTSPPLDVTVSGSRIVIPVGVAVGIEATVYDVEGDDKMAGLWPDNRALAFIRATAMSSVDYFMYGTEVGEGMVRVTATDVEGALEIPFQVVDQP